MDKQDEKITYNPLNYLSENVEINYLMFEKPYEKAWFTFRRELSLKGKLPNLKGIIQIWNKFNVKDFEWWEDFISCNVISLVKIYLLYEVYRMKLPSTRVAEIYDNLENKNSRLQYLDYFIDYYCYLAQQWKEVNFYITDNDTLILTPEEYNMNRQMATSIVWCDSTIQTAIIVSLNEILAKIYKNDDKLRKIKNRLVPLSQKELDILIEMNFNPWLKSINIDFDKENFEPCELSITTKNDLVLNNLEELNKLKEEAKKIKHWKLWDIKVYKDKIILTGDKIKKVRFDKDK